VTTGERASTLEYLAEMDRLLRDIQAELAPDRAPAPPSPPPPPHGAPDSGPATAPDPDRRLQALTELSGRLLPSMRELLAGDERTLNQTASILPPPVRRRPDGPDRSDRPDRYDRSDVALSAGPFPSTEALRDFETALSHLPGVREVAVRAYEGTDRAIIEVRLDHPSP
jgi:hypothetical protein